jgi:hypothetical protein
VRQFRSLGSVRGAARKGRPYRERSSAPYGGNSNMMLPRQNVRCPGPIAREPVTGTFAARISQMLEGSGPF